MISGYLLFKRDGGFGICMGGSGGFIGVEFVLYGYKVFFLRFFLCVFCGVVVCE